MCGGDRQVSSERHDILDWTILADINEDDFVLACLTTTHPLFLPRDPRRLAQLHVCLLLPTYSRVDLFDDEPYTPARRLGRAPASFLRHASPHMSLP